jgi:DNA-binding helix-hairpin-helix protein with protein kinase domain
MIPSRLLDERGNAVAIAKELGRGGEGAVFDVAGQPGIVAKIYLKPPSNQHAAKLSAMAGMASASLLKVAAWPTGTLHDTSGAIAGFTMPKVGGHKPIFQLYLPKPRLQAFPKADWRFLIHAATNTARAFATVHSSGLVIGDVNHGNLVVADDATVQMIDCDSFQVSSRGQTWFCTVGVGTHQPPEMQGRDSYAGVVRTPNHDNFGLAVIIFQLLCMARHPFAGRFQGAGEPSGRPRAGGRTKSASGSALQGRSLSAAIQGVRLEPRNLRNRVCRASLT